MLPLLKQLIDEIGMVLPCALDESLLELTPDTLPSVSEIKAIVLKPTLLGFEKAMQFARSATGLGMIPVVSSTFESGVGLDALVHMAACVNATDVPVGLDTLDWFEEDLLVEPLRIETGALHVAELARLGAEIEPSDGRAVVRGVRRLCGAAVRASDLRASAALVLAGLAARGTTTIRAVHHLDRGYQRLDQKLATLGAQIERGG